MTNTNFFQIVEIRTSKRFKLYAAIPAKFNFRGYVELCYDGGNRPVLSGYGFPRILAFVNTSPEKALEHALDYFESFNLNINLISNWMTNYDEWKFLGQFSPEYNPAPKYFNQ